MGGNKTGSRCVKSVNPMQKRTMREQLVQLGNGAHALAIQILGNADDAADAVQDAYHSVLKRPDAYDASKGPLKPWFLRVVRNRCIDLVRRRRPSGSEADELPTADAGPEQRVETAQRDRALHVALAALPPEQRQILVLRDGMDLSYADIADVLDVAAGTVMSRLHRARQALRRQLIEQGE